MSYYSLDNILEYDSQYYIIYGSRSTGKSYALGKYALDKFFNDGEQFIIIKRYKEDLKKNICENMLSHLYDYIREKYGYKIGYYRNSWRYTTIDNTSPISKWDIIGYAIPLSSVDNAKGSQYPYVTTIIFEEFMSMSDKYLSDEIDLLLNMVSTVARKRLNLKVFLLGNSISKYNPYSLALDLRLDSLKVGEIKNTKWKIKNKTTSITIERTKNVEIIDNYNEENASYTIFGKHYNTMIDEGSFLEDEVNYYVDNVSFNDNLKKLVTSNNYIFFNKKDKLNCSIKFNDYIYNLYLKKSYNNNYVLGVKENENKNLKNISYIFCENKELNFYNNILMIKSLNFNKNEYLHKIVDIIYFCYKNKRIVFTNINASEDIYYFLENLFGIK